MEAEIRFPVGESEKTRRQFDTGMGISRVVANDPLPGQDRLLKRAHHRGSEPISRMMRAILAWA